MAKNMEEIAKEILAGKKLKKAAPGTGKIKLPPPNEKMKAQSALKKAEMTEPMNKKTKKPATNAMERSSKSMASDIAEMSPFSTLEKDLPKSGKVIKIAEEIGEVAPKVAKKGMGRAGRLGAAGLAGGALGLGINALMEGLDAEETGSEEEDMDVAETVQAEKTLAKIKADKAKMAAEKAKMEEEGDPAVKIVKKVAVLPKEPKRPPMPMPKSDEEIVSRFNKRLDTEFGEEDPGPWDDVVEKVMRDEFKKAAKESNKKPLSRYLKR